MPPTPTAARPPGRVRLGKAFWLALLALLLGWVPVLGVLLSVAAVALWGWSHRRKRGISPLGLAVALWGVLVGGLFTGLFFAVEPASDSAVDQARWEAFDRLFDAPPEAGSEP